jgi:hydroxymethylpyrimidine pyrophosphatase-like HAD family hydrolase
MLAFAGQPFIMGNAADELLGRGWKLTRSNAENGVAAAVEYALYGKEITLNASDERSEVGVSL